MRARLLTSAGLFALVLLIAGAATAAAATNGKRAPSPRLSLVSPSNGARISVGTRAFVVRLRAAGPGFMVTIDGHDVTARFGRPRDGVRRARLVRGRDFRLGGGRDVGVSVGWGAIVSSCSSVRIPPR